MVVEGVGVGGCLTSSLQKLSAKLVAWNEYTFGNIFKCKKRNLLRLQGVQKALERNVSEGLKKLELKLKGKGRRFCCRRNSYKSRSHSVTG